MELDTKGLGRLRRVADARDVWTSEAGDFTPWLAENLDVLADELGMSLTLIAMEVPVGEFRLDIQAQTPDGGVVIVENQLERTDHGHLGQLLFYASGLEAAAVVWVAPRFRDDHRRLVSQPGHAVLGAPGPPPDHRRLRTADPLGDLHPGHPVRSQQEDPRPLHHPRR